jgi:hypothetical protein
MGNTKVCMIWYGTVHIKFRLLHVMWMCAGHLQSTQTRHKVPRPWILSFLLESILVEWRNLTWIQELARRAIHPPTSWGAGHFQKWNWQTHSQWPRRTCQPTWILDEFCCNEHLLTGKTPTEIGNLDKCQKSLHRSSPLHLKKASNL